MKIMRSKKQQLLQEREVGRWKSMDKTWKHVEDRLVEALEWDGKSPLVLGASSAYLTSQGPIERKLATNVFITIDAVVVRPITSTHVNGGPLIMLWLLGPGTSTTISDDDTTVYFKVHNDEAASSVYLQGGSNLGFYTRIANIAQDRSVQDAISYVRERRDAHSRRAPHLFT